MDVKASIVPVHLLRVRNSLFTIIFSSFFSMLTHMFLNDFAYSLFNICGDIMRELSDQEVELFDKIGYIPKLNTASSQVRPPVSQPTARRGASFNVRALVSRKVSRKSPILAR